ncbi:hypothetical protein [Alloyangia pacifica]|uniref:hypothetical protein n=1 Tax=Alloyangia pacifica TaxID=311180 RepID=UPI0031E1936D
MLPPDKQPPQPRVKRTIKARMQRFLVHVRRRVPPGLRLVLGLLLICGGILGFLPILGFWMIPLGFAVAMLDVMPLYRRGLERGKSLRRRETPDRPPAERDDDDLT